MSSPIPYRDPSWVCKQQRDPFARITRWLWQALVALVFMAPFVAAVWRAFG